MRCAVFLLIAAAAIAQEQPRLVAQLGHAVPPAAGVYTGDGRFLVTGGADNQIVLWDAATGLELRHKRFKYKVTRLVAGGRNRVLVMFADWHRGTLYEVGDDGPLRAVGRGSHTFADDLSRDGRLVGIASVKVRLRDAESGTDTVVREEPGERCIISPDNRWLAIEEGYRKKLRILEVASGREVAQVEGRYDRYVPLAAFAPDGRTLATTLLRRGYSRAKRSRETTGSIVLWDTATGAEIRRFDVDCEIRRIAFSPDGRRLAAGLDDGAASVALWDVETREALWSTYGSERGEVSSLAFAPDGDELLVCGWDHAAVLDTATGRVLRRLAPAVVEPFAAVLRGERGIVVGSRGGVRHWDGPAGRPVRDVAGAFAPSTDGRWLVAPGYRVLEAATGEERHRWDGEGVPLRPCPFSRDGTRLLTRLEADDEVGLWELPGGKLLQRFEIEGRAPEIHWAVVSPDGSYLVVPVAGHLRIWRLPGFEPAGAIMARARPIRISRDNRLLLNHYAGRTQRAELWDLATREEIMRTPGSVGAAWFSSGGDLVTLVASGRARVVKVSDGSVLREFRIGGSPGLRAGRGNRVLAEGDGAIIDAATGERLVKLPASAKRGGAAAFSPDGTLVFCGVNRDTQLFDARTGEARRRIGGHRGAVRSAAFSPDSRLLAVGDEHGGVGLWDATTGRAAGRLPRQEGKTILVTFLAPDRLLTVIDAAVTRVWEASSGKLLATRRIEELANEVRGAALSPDGTQVATISFNRCAVLRSAATGQEILRLDGHRAPVRCVAFSPDGEALLTGAEDASAIVWDAATGRLRRRFATPRPVTAVAFAPDGKRVLTGSEDGWIRLWEVETGKRLRSLRGHTRDVVSLRFSPDGTSILSAGMDGTTRLWAAGTGRELCRAISMRDGSWAVYDEKGRFDAANGGDAPGLHWVVGNEPITLDQLKERYFEPGLLAKRMGFNTEPLRDVRAFEAPRLYPALRLEREGDRLTIRLRNRGGGIGRVVVKVNGKERTGDARGPGADTDAASLTLVQDLSDDPRLLPGEQNHVEVFAYNGEGYLRSRGFRASFRVAGDRRVVHLWAVVAGVSDYRGEALDLRFAAKDAEDFANALRLAGTRLFGAERTHVTLLGDPDRAQLLDALGALRAGSGDILVLYLAGHGVTHGDRFYYLTRAARTADLQDTAVREAVAISSDELIGAVNRSPALKQVLILDTCASGRLVKDLGLKRSVSSSHVRALERVKDRTGMFVLAGCAADRVSYEASRYGQGLLTYSLLLGMKAGKLRDEQYVDVSTLFNFAADRVPLLARNIGGVQRPIVAQPRGGGSFDIGQLTARDRAHLTLRLERPLLTRSRFLDRREDDDVLDLARRVDRLLKTHSAGRDAKLNFVDAREAADAYRIAGSYVVEGGTVKVRFRVRRGQEPVGDRIEVECDAADRDAVAERVLAKAVEQIR